MRRRTKRILQITGLVLLLLLVAGGIVGHAFAHLALGYAAKTTGSAVLVWGRDLQSVRDIELMDLSWIHVEVDGDRVQASVLGGLMKRHALHRPGLGVTLVDAADTELTPKTLWDGPPPPFNDLADEPVTDGHDSVKTAVARAFEHTADSGIRTRAIVVRHRGRIVAEQYAQGFDRNSVLHGWSMTKSVVSSVFGVLVRQGRIDVHAPAKVPEWQDDQRRNITLDQLLRMSSGLTFEEVYTWPYADAAQMLFGTDDMAALAASKSQAHPPDTVFSYSSGTANLLSRIARETIGGSTRDCLHFIHREFFDPLGLHDAILEIDVAGNFVGSSYMHATARGWSRFGQLHLDDGIVGGKRILPEGWAQYVSTPTPPAKNKDYGAMFWLNRGGVFPDVPADAYFARGHNGQMVAIVPSRKVVIVRLAWDREGAEFGWNKALDRVLRALPD